MDTNVQPVKAERAEVGGPTWLRVKSQVKAGAKGLDFGPADDQERASTLTPLTTRVTSSRSAKVVEPDARQRGASEGPTWLQVKSHIRAGGDVDDPFKSGFASGDPDGSSTTFPRLTEHVAGSLGVRATCVETEQYLAVERKASAPTWLRVKSELRAGGEVDPVKPGFAQGMADNPSLTFARLSTRAKLTL